MGCLNQPMATARVSLRLLYVLAADFLLKCHGGTRSAIVYIYTIIDKLKRVGIWGFIVFVGMAEFINTGSSYQHPCTALHVCKSAHSSLTRIRVRVHLGAR